MREIRMSGSEGRGRKAPYPIASWRGLCGVKLSADEPRRARSWGRGGRHDRAAPKHPYSEFEASCSIVLPPVRARQACKP